MENKIRGFRQVLAATYKALSNAEKMGIVWFVRESKTDKYGDIYFGTRHYGHYGSEAEDIIEINQRFVDAGIVDASGQTVDIRSMIIEAQLEAGTGIDITDGTISANSDAVTTEDIAVTVDLGAGFSKDTTIPAGTSIQDLLVKLLSKELWATSVSTGTTFSGSVGKPTVSLGETGTVEVGTVVNLSATANETYSSAQTVTAKTMTYGYFDGAKQEGNANFVSATTYTETLSPTKSGDVKLASSYTGFTASTKTVTATTLSENGLVVVEGTNTAKVSETGATIYAATDVTAKDIYVATNLKNTSKSETDQSDWVVSIPSTWKGTASTATTSNNSASITGAYKYYYGFAPLGLANTLANLTDDEIYEMSSNWITKDGTTTIISAKADDAVTAGGNVVIAVPSKYKLASITEKLSGNSVLDNFASETRTLNIGGTSTTTYKVYYWSAASAPTYYNVTITKA